MYLLYSRAGKKYKCLVRIYCRPYSRETYTEHDWNDGYRHAANESDNEGFHSDLPQRKSREDTPLHHPPRVSGDALSDVYLHRIEETALFST